MNALKCALLIVWIFIWICISALLYYELLLWLPVFKVWREALIKGPKEYCSLQLERAPTDNQFKSDRNLRWMSSEELYRMAGAKRRMEKVK